MKELELVSFENNYIQTKENFSVEDGDIFASVTIDGFPADDNEEGQSVAEIFCTQHGDIIVAWHHNAYRWNEEILPLIEESKKILKEMYEKDALGVSDTQDFPDEIKSTDGDATKALNEAIRVIIEAISVGVLSSQEEGYVSVIYDDGNGHSDWVSMPIFDAAIDLNRSGYIDTLKEEINKAKGEA